MKLRFDVDQAECLRKGIDCPKSIVTVDVTPAELNQQQREAIADRMDGIDVLRLSWRHPVANGFQFLRTKASKKMQTAYRVEAKAPTFDALWEAIQQEETTLEAVPIEKE